MNQENKERKSIFTQNKVIKITVAILIFAVVFSAGFFCRYIIENVNSRKLNSVISIIKREGIYLTEDFENGDEINENVIKAVVANVLSQDNYAEYYTKKEYAKIKGDNSGNTSGFGFSLLSDCVIYSVVGNSNAENQGLRAGDKILGYKKSSQTDFTAFENSTTLYDFIDTLSPNEECVFKVLKPSSEVKEYAVKYGDYKISFVKYFDDSTALTIYPNEKGEVATKNYNFDSTLGLDGQTAMIKISLFHGDMVKQFKTALNIMEQKNKTKLIIDLRGNGGGDVTCLEDLCQYLINNKGSKNSTILTSKYKNGNTERFATSKNNYISFVQKTVVLADDGTASASEALIGAMLCYGKEDIDNNFSTANLVIEKSSAYGKPTTYGKGIMQKTYEFLDGSAIKLTTARIFWPDGETCIQDVGITTTAQNTVENGFAVSRAKEILN